jgi:SAM-dependent methyltransferase
MNRKNGDLDSLQKDFSRVWVLPGVTAWDYLMTCRRHQPALYQLLNPTRVPFERVTRLFADISQLSTHFESKLESGRGDSYRAAQNANYLIRSVGYLHLFDLATAPRTSPVADLTILDALGGNGTLTRIVRASRPTEKTPFIVTSDVSGRMIESALGQNLPAIRLPLQDLIWFDDAIFDAVIVAYGTHHIPHDDQSRALAEAYRVLKPGGRVILQDFEIGCPTTLWYEQILDRYTLTGHKYEYFTRQRFNDLLVENAFIQSEVMDIYDPFILYGEDPNVTKRQLLEYVFTLFALEKLVPTDGILNDEFWDQLETLVRETSTFEPGRLPADSNGICEFTVFREGNRYRAEIPRVCLAATGLRKP